jgi:predicted Holliday junction resolvase-like endonuclease
MGENRVLDQALYSVTGIAKELEIKNKQLQQELDKYKTKEKELREYCNDKSQYWGNDSYINGKNEENEEVKKDILDILDKE